MPVKDSRVDAYIAKSAAFAQPILKRVRQAVHAACPAVEETIKWGVPHFLYRGMFCGMAAFKQHAMFGFWHRGMGEELKRLGREDVTHGRFGALTSVADLPPKATLVRLVKHAMKLNEQDAKSPRKKAAKKSPKKRAALKIPADFLAALGKNKKAHKTFTAFSYSHQKEYVEWITEAKRDETRQKRLKAAIEMLAEGKTRHWKYQRK
jgi:hypothetical protein